MLDRDIAEASSKVWVEDATKGSSREERKRLAGLKSRDKKKRYVERLEEDVKLLTAEIEKYDANISKCKHQVM